MDFYIQDIEKKGNYMKKTFLIILVFVMMVSLTGCFKKKGTEEEKAVKQKQSQQLNEQETEESFFGSMKDLLARNKSLKCTYKNIVGEEVMVGTVYIADNKARSEFEIKEGDQKMEMNSIVDGDWVYVWSNSMPKGTKINMKEMQGENFNDQAKKSDLEKDMDYKCRSWIKDSSKFEVPKDIEFQDITEMIKGFQNTMQDIDMEDAEKNAESAQQMICDICEMAPTPEEQKKCKVDAQCK